MYCLAREMLAAEDAPPREGSFPLAGTRRLASETNFSLIRENEERKDGNNDIIICAQVIVLKEGRFFRLR